MIRLHLKAPILPEGAELTADLNGASDIKFLTSVVNAAYAEAEKSGAPRSTIREVEQRMSKLERHITSLLPSMTKLSIANGGTEDITV